MPRRKSIRPAGTVIVLPGARRSRRRPGATPRQICRVYVEFLCWHCGGEFTATVVAEYDRIKYSTSAGVGPILTPPDKRPKWCSSEHKADARRAPLRDRICAYAKCARPFRTHQGNKVYHSPACRVAAAKERRQRRRPPPTPGFEFMLPVDQAARLVGGSPADLAAMRDAARRIAAELEQEAAAQMYARRLAEDPAFREHERRRQAEALAAAARERAEAEVREAMLGAAWRIAAEIEAEAEARIAALQQEAVRLQALARREQDDANRVLWWDHEYDAFLKAEAIRAEETEARRADARVINDRRWRAQGRHYVDCKTGVFARCTCACWCHR